jgi:hypothetical protein
VSGPALEAAARGLAAQVTAGRFRTLRAARKLGWLHLAVGPAYAAFAIVVLIVTYQDGERVLGVLAVVNGGLLSLTGVPHLPEPEADPPQRRTDPAVQPERRRPRSVAGRQNGPRRRAERNGP